MKIIANGISIEVEDTPPTDAYNGQTVLLIMGLGMQLIAWPPALVQGLTDAGYRVLRFDNRDIGLSQHFDHLGKPNVVWASIKLKLGLKIKAPYSLKDMCADALGVLDAMRVPSAHVVGVSMGGMIAQRLALLAPDRVASLTSIMSSSGAPGLPQAAPKVLRALLSRPNGVSAKAVEDHYVRLFKVIGSPGFPVAEPLLRERIAAGIARSNHPVGTLRQMLAIATDSRHTLLHTIALPTLVVHGVADALVPFANGEDTARRIRGARMVSVDGMGHDLPPGVVERLLTELLSFLPRVTGLAAAQLAVGGAAATAQ